MQQYGYIKGVYYHKPDELKIKKGCPRKYIGNTENMNYTKKDPLLVSQVRTENAIAQRGVAIVELDYYTGEYIAEYSCIREFADDYELSPASVSSAMNRNNHAVCYLHKHEKLFMKKENFELMLNSMKGLMN